MKMPKKLKIFKVTYKVLYKNMDEYGVTDFQNAEILINPSYPLKVQRRTLLHEILHVVGEDRLRYVYDMLSGGSEVSKDTIEHLVIDPIANGLDDVLTSNPKLIKYIQGEN